jgi:alpha-1,3-rhamnosyl/mannosyltransferase
VVTIPHGVAWPPAEVTPADEVRVRFGLDGPVVLYPAITYPHKDHATLVAAFALAGADHPDAVLVLTGGEGACEADVRRQISRLGLGDRVRRLGRVSDADVAGLYSVATVVAVPSTYEGFGLPAAEAMAAGVPLVAARATAIPEVVGDAGVLVEPGDVPAWGAAIGRLLGVPAERDELAARGRERARRYTWSANAAALAELYRTAAAGL